MDSIEIIIWLPGTQMKEFTGILSVKMQLREKKKNLQYKVTLPQK